MDIERVNSTLNKAIIGLQSDEIEGMIEAMAGGYRVPSPSQMGFGGIQPKEVKPAKVSGAPKPKTMDEFFAEHKRAQKYLDKHATSVKHNHWWIPPHNLMLHEDTSGMDLWKFDYAIGFSHEGNKSSNPVNGLVVAPYWSKIEPKKGRLGTKFSRGAYFIDVEFAKDFIKRAKRQPTVSGRINQDLDMIEREHKVKVPAVVRKRLVSDVLKVAKRRMGAKGEPPKKLYPFDGSKPTKTNLMISR